MNKLREIITNLNVANSNDVSKEKHEEIRGIIEELLPYAELEEELGIDLIKLIKCIRNEKGIWKKDFDGGLINTRCMLACYFGRWQIYDKENIYDLKDYGKTWALTEEELL